MNIADEIKDSFRNGNSLTRLIYINVGVFLIIHIILIFLFLFSSSEKIDLVLNWLAVPADPQTLLHRPWTVITYMFLHFDFFHILFNILWLYWFGKIFLTYLDEKRLLNVYLLGGISGAILYFASYNLVPVLQAHSANSVAMGASAAVMAIVIAAAFYAPNHTVYVFLVGPVKIIWLALIVFILSSLVDFSVNTGGKIAHIGGALFGYVFIAGNKNGKDITAWFTRIMDAFFSLFKPRKKLKVNTAKQPTTWNIMLLKRNSRKTST
jgi:membrane associated rhomboid family serine protease